MRQATHISPSRFLEQYIPTLGETTPYVFKTYTVCCIPVSDIGRKTREYHAASFIYLGNNMWNFKMVNVGILSVCEWCTGQALLAGKANPHPE